jgi:hypothetical protein
LHFSVHACDGAEVKRFTERLYYLRLLLAAPAEIPVAHLLIAHVNETYRQRANDHAWVEGAARELATLLKNDNPTLMNILYAIDPG